MWRACPQIALRDARRLRKASSINDLGRSLWKCRQLSNASSEINMLDFPPELVRNFGIIAHVDHGKSTLADRLLELTGTIPTSKTNKQVLDKLKVEKERGITVKAQTVSIVVPYKGQKYLLNLVDSPGHIDFSFEVERSLNAVQGALLIVDASQGIQAQTYTVFDHALQRDLTIIPVLNKIDLDAAKPAEVAEQIETTFGLAASDCLQISAKSGYGCAKVLEQIIERIPSPPASPTATFQALLFDSYYDNYRGTINLIALKSGCLKVGDKVKSSHSQKTYEVQDLGILQASEVKTSCLSAGHVGWIATSMKGTDEALLGDILTHASETLPSTPLFARPKPMIFAGFFPIDNSEFGKLEEAILQLLLTDASVSIQRVSSNALGQGVRVGMLGQLHMDVFQQRLADDYKQDIIVTAPSVTYKILYKDGSEALISNPSDFPSHQDRESIHDMQEPIVMATIITPVEYLGVISNLCANNRGVQDSIQYMTPERLLLRYKLPLSEIASHFHDTLKSATSGYATFDYTDAGFASTRLDKIEIWLAGSPIDALSLIVHHTNAYDTGKFWVHALSKIIPKQQFEVAIQAKVGTRAIAAQKIAPYRKDVLADIHGGRDVLRKKAVLDRQKAGKKRLKSVGRIQLPQDTFAQILSMKRR